MKFTRLEIPEIVLIEPSIHGDERGYFFESFRADLLENFLGFKINFCQDNESKSAKGVLRGLHYQLPPFAQSKLVRVIRGSVVDVVVDIRAGSPSFGKGICVKLDSQNKRQLFIPRGFAHGFITLEDNSIFAYKVDNYYSAKNERGIYFLDENLSVWGELEKTINALGGKEKINFSPKDSNAPRLSQMRESELFIYGKNYYV